MPSYEHPTPPLARTPRPSSPFDQRVHATLADPHSQRLRNLGYLRSMLVDQEEAHELRLPGSYDIIDIGEQLVRCLVLTNDYRHEAGLVQEIEGLMRRALRRHEQHLIRLAEELEAAREATGSFSAQIFARSEWPA